MDAALAPASEPIQPTKSLPSDYNTPLRAASSRSKSKAGSGSKHSHTPPAEILHTHPEAEAEAEAEAGTSGAVAIDPWDDTVIRQVEQKPEQTLESSSQPSPQPSWANMAGADSWQHTA